MRVYRGHPAAQPGFLMYYLLSEAMGSEPTAKHLLSDPVGADPRPPRQVFRFQGAFRGM